MNQYTFPSFRENRERLDGQGGIVRPYYAKIETTARALPDQVVTNEDIIARNGHEVAASAIYKMQGVKERRVAPEGVVDTDLLFQAASTCLERANIRPEQLSKLIVTKFLGDRALPMCAALLQKRLDCEVAVQAFDVDGGINSFMNAVDTAICAIESGDGPILIVSGGVINRMVSRTDPRLAFLFGDGAAAILLTPSKEPQILSSFSFTNHQYSDLAKGFEMRGSIAQDLHEKEAYDTLYDLYHQENWKKGKEFVLKSMALTAQKLLDDANKEAADIDLWLVTENHHRLWKAIVEELNIPMNKTISLISDMGNTMSAMLPMLLDEGIQSGKASKGSMVMMLSVGEGISGGGILLTL